MTPIFVNKKFKVVIKLKKKKTWKRQNVDLQNIAKISLKLCKLVLEIGYIHVHTLFKHDT